MSNRDVVVLAILLLVAYLVQWWLSFLQSKDVSSTWSRLARERAGSGYIGMNRRKRLGVAPVVILLIDNDLSIASIWMMKGLLTTARMREQIMPCQCGVREIEMHREELERAFGRKGFLAIRDAGNNVLASMDNRPE